MEIVLRVSINFLYNTLFIHLGNRCKILFLFLEFFRESYLKDFEKLWNNRHVPPIKQSAIVQCDLQEKPVIVMSLHEILIQLKSDTSKMVVDGVMLKYSEETLLTLLKDIESSYVAAFLDVIIDEKPYLDNNVKGFEHMSFDWVLALCKFYSYDFKFF